jgi:Tat protein translocase TatB subunit
MFGTLGGPELFLIFVVALIVFGPRKLPEIGKSLGKMMGEFRRASNEFRSTIENEVEAEKIRDAMRIEPPKVEPLTAAPAGGATSSPAAAGSGEPAVTDYPGGPEAAPAVEPPPLTEPPATAATAVPETVSRQPADTSIDPK